MVEISLTTSPSKSAPPPLTILLAYSTRDDVITLQNPHGLPSGSVTKPVPTAVEVKPSAAKPSPTPGTTKSKAPVPCQYFPPYKPRFLRSIREYIALFDWTAWGVAHFNFGGPSDGELGAVMGRRGADV